MTIRVFVSGQSNALGRGSGGPDWSTIDSRVRVWNNVNPLGGNGTAFTDPVTAQSVGTFDLTNRNNFGVWFCDRLARYADDDVDMTIVARGGSGIIEWAPSGYTYPMLQECIDVWGATGQPPADVFLWHQGETNSSGDPSAWQASFLALVGNLTAAGVLSAETVIILGGLADQALAIKPQFNSLAIRPVASANRRYGYAEPGALATTDGTHFTGDALYTLGSERYFSAYLSASADPIHALANVGGTVGDEGSGQNVALDMSGYVSRGYRLRGSPRLLTVSQTYYVDDDVQAILVEAIAGGGGGGGAKGDDGVPRASSGGGSGAYAQSFIVSPQSSYDVVIGAGGAGGAAESTGFAGSGGNTEFGDILSCEGGVGGFASGSSSAPVILGGGRGGVASGPIAVDGQRGGTGFKLADTARISGAGASSRLGGGGDGRSHSTTVGNFGFPGTGYGAGGGGATSGTTQGYAGGDGSPGVVIVWEFVR